MQAYLILVVEDDPKMGPALETILAGQGYGVELARSGEEALQAVAKTRFDVVICDLKLPGINGMEVLRAVRGRQPEVSFIIMTAYATVDSAVQAMKEGAEDYIAKPFTMEALLIQVEKVCARRDLRTQNALLQGQLARKYEFDNLIGDSEAMVEVYKLITRIKDSRSTVLIQGETGTGKELVARAIHYNSLRAGQVFLPVNCGAFQENLLASELFGYVKGAFTGAHTDKRGIFEVARGGTVFLDEIGDVSPGMQQVLLRTLDRGEIQPVGTTRRTRVEVRIIAASNKDLAAMVSAGEFREDLYYRLNVVTIRIPPLRERPEDIAGLARHFLHRYARENGRHIEGLTREALEMLENYPWPGNVRELENTMARAALLAEGDSVTPEDLPPGLQCSGAARRALPGDNLTLEELEQAHIGDILAQCGGNKARAARVLGINRSTLWRMLQKYGLSPEVQQD